MSQNKCINSSSELIESIEWVEAAGKRPSGVRAKAVLTELPYSQKNSPRERMRRLNFSGYASAQAGG
jgi:hypothetical protein